MTAELGMFEGDSHMNVPRGSERNFGLVFGAVFALIGLWPLRHGDAPHVLFLALAALMVALALFAPTVLRRPNGWWFRLGLMLGAVVAPIVMTLVYVITVVPIGLLMRALGHDLLATRLDPERESYWVEREAPPQPLNRQF